MASYVKSYRCFPHSFKGRLPIRVNYFNVGGVPFLFQS